MTGLPHHAIDLLFTYAQRLPILRRNVCALKFTSPRGIVGPRRHSKEDASKEGPPITVSADPPCKSTWKKLRVQQRSNNT